MSSSHSIVRLATFEVILFYFAFLSINGLVLAFPLSCNYRSKLLIFGHFIILEEALGFLKER